MAYEYVILYLSMCLRLHTVLQSLSYKSITVCVNTWIWCTLTDW